MDYRARTVQYIRLRAPITQWRARSLLLAVFKSGRDLARVAEIGALRQWWKELRAGVSGQDMNRASTWRTDALWRAACLEARARDFDALGLLRAADNDRRQAALIAATIQEPT
jgi:hypothetical protein